MISEKGLCKILKSAFKNGGYSVIQVRSRAETQPTSWRRNEIIVNGATRAVRCITEDLPKAAAVQIVEDVGYMPMDAVTVQKNQPNQTMLESVAGTRGNDLERVAAGGVRMRQIPVIFRERWQLYQTENGDVYAFDTELLKLIDFKEAEPSAFMSQTGTWECLRGEIAPFTSPLGGSPGPMRRRSCILPAWTGRTRSTRTTRWPT